MCIRDRDRALRARLAQHATKARHASQGQPRWLDIITQDGSCLLYTSDAADERSSVDLGGRRIIKKKKNIHLATREDSYVHQEVEEVDKAIQVIYERTEQNRGR